MLTEQFLADTSTRMRKVWGVLGRSTCVEAREASGTSPAKQLTHTGSISESPEQSPHQSKYSQDERETGPTIGYFHPGAKMIYASWFMIWFLSCVHTRGVDIILILQGRQQNLQECKLYSNYFFTSLARFSGILGSVCTTNFCAENMLVESVCQFLRV